MSNRLYTLALRFTKLRQQSRENFLVVLSIFFTYIDPFKNIFHNRKHIPNKAKTVLESCMYSSNYLKQNKSSFANEKNQYRVNNHKKFYTRQKPTKQK